MRLSKHDLPTLIYLKRSVVIEYFVVNIANALILAD